MWNGIPGLMERYDIIEPGNFVEQTAVVVLHPLEHLLVIGSVVLNLLPDCPFEFLKSKVDKDTCKNLKRSKITYIIEIKLAIGSNG